MVVYTVRVAVIGQSTNNHKKQIGLLQIPKRYYFLWQSFPILVFGSAINYAQKYLSYCYYFVLS